MWRITLAREFAVRQPLSENLAHGLAESLVVVHLFPIVVAEYLLVHIARQVERLYRYIGSCQRSLQQAPEVFQSVRVDSAVDVPLGVIHHIVHEAVMQFVVTDGLIGVDRRAVLYLLQYLILQCFALHIRHNLGANLPQIAVKDSHHDGFVGSGAALLDAESPAFEHVRQFPANWPSQGSSMGGLGKDLIKPIRVAFQPPRHYRLESSSAAPVNFPRSRSSTSPIFSPSRFILRARPCTSDAARRLTS